MTTLQTSIIPIAEGFAPAVRADWLALVEKTIKGADVSTLISRTADGLAIAPLYAADDAAAPAAFTPAPRGGERAWDVRAVVRAASPVEANRQALTALAGGASSVLLAIDPTGARGVALGSADDLAATLSGVMLDLAPVALDAGFLGSACAAWLGAAAKASPAAPLAFHSDPISAFAAAGASPGPITAHVLASADVLAQLAQTYPKASLFLASGAVVHEAGGSAALELGFAAAAVVAYAKALVGAGMDRRDAFSRIVVGLSVDHEPLTTVAKLRAARVLWRRITSACDAETPARIEARSSNRMLTRADSWSNLVRLTASGFAAAVGGADAVALGCISDAAGEPGDLALRMARNAQLILMEEAHVGAVIDPAAGAWSFETLTADLAHAAWDAFTAIEAAGGVISALTSGMIADKVAAQRAALAASVSDGRRKIVGVTDFKSAEPSAKIAARQAHSAHGPDISQPGADSVCPALKPVRLEEMAQ